MEPDWRKMEETIYGEIHHLFVEQRAKSRKTARELDMSVAEFATMSVCGAVYEWMEDNGILDMVHAQRPVRRRAGRPGTRRRAGA